MAVAEYIEKKRAAALAPLAKAKLWQRVYDPRPPQEGDIVKTTGRMKIPMPLDYPDAKEIQRELVPADKSSLMSEYPAIGLEPGFTFRKVGTGGVEFTSDVYTFNKYLYDFGRVEYVVEDPPDSTKLSAEQANLLIALPMTPGGASQMEYMLKHSDWNIAERREPIAEGATFYEAFEELLTELDEPGLPELYQHLAPLFLKGEITREDVSALKEYAPYLEWSRKFNEPVTFQPRAGVPLGMELKRLREALDDYGIDLATNEMKWDSEPEWSRGDFKIIPLTTRAEYMRQGDLLDQCIQDLEEHPYYAMSKAGHWTNYGLMNKTGRPVATICVATKGKKMTVLENRGNANTSLSPGATRGGKSGKYASIIDAWLEDMEAQGYMIDRESENVCHAPQHPEHGLQALGYRGDFYGDLQERPDTTDWETLPSNRDPFEFRLGNAEHEPTIWRYYRTMSASPERFVDGRPRPDYELGANIYERANKIRIEPNDLATVAHYVYSRLSGGFSELDKIINVVALTNLFIAHNDALNRVDDEEKWRQEFRQELADVATNPAESSASPVSRWEFSDQQELNLSEQNQEDWARLLLKITDQVFAQPLDKTMLPGAGGAWQHFSVQDYLRQTINNVKQEISGAPAKPELKELKSADRINLMGHRDRREPQDPGQYPLFVPDVGPEGDLDATRDLFAAMRQWRLAENFPSTYPTRGYDPFAEREQEVEDDGPELEM